MGIAKLYSQSGEKGFTINGIIKDYYVYAGEKVSTGDFVKFVNGVASQTTETSVDTAIDSANTYTGRYISAIELSDNRVFIAHSYGSSYYLYGIVCTINGVGITCGTDTQIFNFSVSDFDIALIDENKVFIAYGNYQNDELMGVVCTINGNSVSRGTSKDLIGDEERCLKKPSLIKLDTNKVLISYTLGSSYYLGTIVCTISGTTMTAGTETRISSTNYSGYSTSMVKVEDNKVFIAHSYNSSYYLYGVVCTINGTTITGGSITALNTTTARTGEKISTTLLPGGNVFVASSYSTSYYLYGIICSISGTSISKGANIQISANAYASFALSATTLPDGNVFIACCTDSSGFYLYGVICTVSGTEFTAGTITQLNVNRYTGYTMSAITLNNGTVFIAHDYSSNHYLYTQIFGVDETNNIPTNNVVIKEYENQVRKATTSDIYGVAKTGGMGGDSTGHKDIISIYQPISAFNLVVNGDFRNELEGWDFVSGANGEYTIIKENDDKILRVVCTVNSPGIKMTIPNADLGNHIYYISLYEKFMYASDETGYIYISFGGSDINDDKTNYTNQWYHFTKRTTPSTSHQLFSIYIYNNYSSSRVGDTMWLKNIKLYDLTAMFGEGKEPTQEWCDANL